LCIRFGFAGGIKIRACREKEGYIFLTIGVQMGPSKWHPQIELGTCNKTKYIVKLQEQIF